MTSTACASIVALSLVFGCNGAATNVDATSTTGTSSPVPHVVPTARGGGPPSVPHEAEVERIARAHCDLFVRCGSVAPERWSSCFAREVRDVGEGIAANGCADGIDASKLTGCLATMAADGGATCASSLPRSCAAIELCGPPTDKATTIDRLLPSPPAEPDRFLRDITVRNAGTQRLIEEIVGPQRLDLRGDPPQTTDSSTTPGDHEHPSDSASTTSGGQGATSPP